MKTKIKYMVALLLCAMSVTACFKDKGDYDYTNINQLTIDTVGFAAKGLAFSSTWPMYRVELGDEVTLDEGFELNVTYGNRSLDHLQYAWILSPYPYQQTTQGNELVWPSVDTICRTKILQWKVENLEPYPKMYNLTFMAHDTQTGDKAYYQFTGNIWFDAVGAISGIYVLSEYDGNTDIDIYKTDRYLLTTTNTGVLPTIEKQKFSQVHGAPINGKPLYINTRSQNFYVFTDQDALLLNYQSGLQIMQRKESMFTQMPEQWNPQVFNARAASAVSNCGMLINDGKLYAFFAETGESTPQFSPALSTIDGKDYQLDNYIAINVYRSSAGRHITVFYDKKNNCYRPYYNGARSTIGAFQCDPNSKLDITNITGRVITTMTTGSNRIFSFIEQDDPDNSGQKLYYLYKLNFYSLQSGPTTDFVDGTPVNMSACPDIAKATMFASNNDGNAFIYATDKAVYGVGPNSSSTNPTWHLIHTLEAGEEVTMLQTSWKMGWPNSADILWIGIWNESANEGTLVEYKINTTTGKPYEQTDLANDPVGIGYPDLPHPFVTKGFGKIKQLATSSGLNL